MEVCSVTTILLLIFVIGSAQIPGCSVRLKELSERSPLLLRPGGPLNVSSFPAPDADQVLHLQTNATLLLACPGPGNQLLFGNRTTGLRQVNATCTRDSAVAVRGSEVDLRTVQCALHAERTAEKDARRRCGAGARGQRVRIGFRLLSGFLELIAACFDDRLLSPIYSNYTLLQSSARAWSEIPRVDFRAGRFFGSVDPALQYSAQQQVLQGHVQRLGSEALMSTSLTPDAGPAYAPLTSAMFYVNAAPQWRSVNAGAWAAVERAARSLAAARGDLLVVTGVYGVASLPSSDGTRTPLFLVAQDAQPKMPVPALYWKVVYDPRTQEGAAVVGNNNPWEPLAAHPELRLCPDVCARLLWLPAPPADVYCCEVDALRLRVEDVPPLAVRGLLDGPGTATEPPPTDPPTSEATSTESPSTEGASTEPLPSYSPDATTPRSDTFARLPQHAAGSSHSTVLESCRIILMCTLSIHLTFFH